MRKLTSYFFQITDSFMFEVYVKVSRHLNIPIIDVIRGKFDYNIRLLIMYYTRKIREEQEEIREIRKKNEELNKQI